MANTKSRKGLREPRLFWHELPLGHLPLGGEVSIHQLREALLPMLERAVPRTWPDELAAMIKPECFVCDHFWLGHTKPWSNHRGDRTFVRYWFHLKAVPLLQCGDRRRLKRLFRPRKLTGWLAKGTSGGISLYVLRRRHWKSGQYLVQS